MSSNRLVCGIICLLVALVSACGSRAAPSQDDLTTMPACAAYTEAMTACLERSTPNRALVEARATLARDAMLRAAVSEETRIAMNERCGRAETALKASCP